MFSTTPSEEVKKRAQAFFEAFLPEWEKGVTLKEFFEKYGKFHYSTLYYYLKVACNFDPARYKKYHEKITSVHYNRVNPVIKTSKQVVIFKDNEEVLTEERNLFTEDIEKYLNSVKSNLQKAEDLNRVTKSIIGGI